VTAIVGVRYRRAGKIYYFDAEAVPDLAVGDRVIVDTSRGRELGQVVIAPGQVVDAQVGEVKPVLRKATWDDLTRLARLRTKEPAVLQRVRRRIAEHELPMRALLAEYSYDGSRLTVYFVSEEQRVDFRALVRDLARLFRARVHLRQIGPRDQAKMLGGIDRCGRELCCSTWLAEFRPISIRMAKNQNQPLNPSEISGVCGKLLCCLAFEDELYKEMRTGLPKVGAKLSSAVGRGKVVDVNVLARKVTIEWETGTRVEVDAQEFADLKERRDRIASGEVSAAGTRTQARASGSRADTTRGPVDGTGAGDRARGSGAKKGAGSKSGGKTGKPSPSSRGRSNRARRKRKRSDGDRRTSSR
jgi:cell fate regulator YaaT (PSP1 superfamily)